MGKCKALYDFVSEKKDELNIKEGTFTTQDLLQYTAGVKCTYCTQCFFSLNVLLGDLLNILRKDHSGWWYGELNGKTGHFPFNYVEELPVLKVAKSSDA